MKEQQYTNKAEQPQTATKIMHKVCHGKVRRVAGGRLWCETCQQYVDATECKHE